MRMHGTVATVTVIDLRNEYVGFQPLIISYIKLTSHSSSTLCMIYLVTVDQLLLTCQLLA